MYIKDSTIIVKGHNNKLVFGNGNSITGLRLLIIGSNNVINFGDGVHINASKIQPTVINAIGSKTIKLGRNCLLSNNIEIHTSDYHGIYSNANQNRINPDSDIEIGEKVWICLGSTILKGTKIAKGCIIGAKSLVTHCFEEENCIIAGSPAEIIKRNVNWTPERK